MSRLADENTLPGPFAATRGIEQLDGNGSVAQFIQNQFSGGLAGVPAATGRSFADPARIRLEKAEIDKLLRRVRQNRHISLKLDPNIKLDHTMPHVKSNHMFSSSSNHLDANDVRNASPVQVTSIKKLHMRHASVAPGDISPISLSRQYSLPIRRGSGIMASLRQQLSPNVSNAPWFNQDLHAQFTP